MSESCGTTRVKGSRLRPDQQSAVLARFPHRYTREHIPYAVKRATDPPPIPFDSDADWLAHTLFTMRDGELDLRVTRCESNPTWPDNPELRDETTEPVLAVQPLPSTFSDTKLAIYLLAKIAAVTLFYHLFPDSDTIRICAGSSYILVVLESAMFTPWAICAVATIAATLAYSWFFVVPLHSLTDRGFRILLWFVTTLAAITLVRLKGTRHPLARFLS